MSAADFSAISGAPDDVARDYLSRAGGNLELALSNFFERSSQGLQDNFAVDEFIPDVVGPAVVGQTGGDLLVFDPVPPPATDARCLRAPVCGLFQKKVAPADTSKATELVPVPLAGARVSAVVRDFAAQVTLEQRFVNSGANAVELTFRLRLEGSSAVSRALPPTAIRSALTSFSATVDGKAVTAECKEKEEALDAYDDGIASGNRAFLIEQDSKIPDSFSMSVGNVAPGTEATVRVEYVTELLTTTDGNIELLLPTGGSAPSVAQSSLTTEPDHLTGMHVEVTASNSCGDFSTVACASHATTALEPAEGSELFRIDGTRAYAKYRIADVGGQDTRLIFELQKHQNGASVVWEPTTTGGALCLSFRADLDANALQGETPMELIFVVDRSGSMAGSRMRNCQQALQLFLRSLPLRAVKFNIVSFGDRHESLWPSAVLYDEDTLHQASTHVASMKANFGGTELLRPLQSILQPSTSTSGDGKVIPRQIFVLTDGDIANTGALVKYVETHVGDHSRVFALGIGAEASRDLVVGIAAAGRGDADFVGSGSEGDSIQVKVLQQVRSALKPVLRSLRVDWGDVASLLDDDSRTIYGLDSSTTESSRLPPVFAGQRCVLYARLRDQAARDALAALVATGGGEIRIIAETDSVDEDATDPLERVFTEEHQWTVPYASFGSGSADAGGPGKAEQSSTSFDFTFVSTLAVVNTLGYLSSTAGHSDEHELKRRLCKMALDAHIASSFTSLVAIADATGQAATGELAHIDVNAAPLQKQIHASSQLQPAGEALAELRLADTRSVMLSNIDTLMDRSDKLDSFSDSFSVQSAPMKMKKEQSSSLARRVSGSVASFASSLSKRSESSPRASAESAPYIGEDEDAGAFDDADYGALEQEKESMQLDESLASAARAHKKSTEFARPPQEKLRPKAASLSPAKPQSRSLAAFGGGPGGGGSGYGGMPTSSSSVFAAGRGAPPPPRASRDRESEESARAEYGALMMPASPSPAASYASPPPPAAAIAPLSAPVAFVDVPLAPVDSSSRAVDRLIQLQRADGSWLLDSRLSREIEIDRDQCLASLDALCKQLARSDTLVWSWVLATALAVARLKAAFPESESEWALVVEKATKRISRFCAKESVDASLILNFAAKVLKPE